MRMLVLNLCMTFRVLICIIIYYSCKTFYVLGSLAITRLEIGCSCEEKEQKTRAQADYS